MTLLITFPKKYKSIYGFFLASNLLTYFKNIICSPYLIVLSDAFGNLWVNISPSLIIGYYIIYLICGSIFSMIVSFYVLFSSLSSGTNLIANMHKWDSLDTSTLKRLEWIMTFLNLDYIGPLVLIGRFSKVAILSVGLSM